MRLLLLLLPALVHCALPPGYEEELFCLPSTCLRQRARGHGFCGSRAAFHECCNMTSWETAHGPRWWGVKIEESVKDAMVSAGWSGSVCAEEGVCGRLKHYVAIERFVDMLVMRSV